MLVKKWRWCALAVWIVGLALCCDKAAWAHPHHASIGTASWIEASQSFEVELRLSVVDLEEVLTKRAGRAVELDATASEVASALEAYVASGFYVRAKSGTIVKPKWIGFEIEEPFAWVYVELPLGALPREDCKLRHALLVAEYAEQVNLLNVRQGKKRQTLKFRRRREELALPPLKTP